MFKAALLNFIWFKIEMLKFCRCYIFYTKENQEYNMNTHKCNNLYIFLFAMEVTGKIANEKVTQIKFEQKMIKIFRIDCYWDIAI